MCRDLKLVEVADQKCKFFCIKKLGVVIVVNRRSRKSELDEQNKRKKILLHSCFIIEKLLARVYRKK